MIFVKSSNAREIFVTSACDWSLFQALGQLVARPRFSGDLPIWPGTGSMNKEAILKRTSDHMIKNMKFTDDLLDD